MSHQGATGKISVHIYLVGGGGLHGGQKNENQRVSKNIHTGFQVPGRCHLARESQNLPRMGLRGKVSAAIVINTRDRP